MQLSIVTAGVTSPASTAGSKPERTYPRCGYHGDVLPDGGRSALHPVLIPFMNVALAAVSQLSG
ncbi:hypothetical protein [Mesorhizobium sangaii]|uniref:Uncharacterized protein n=1 Tax=Mesorhizobium sangaii TaxID=505389 RepID=A0A841P644_9HYPH|nr:hypothetical protein [Mesorhizobium sangaii]MBB6410697.1 hypothetical protein [Mesorhizobium sangaii]